MTSPVSGIAGGVSGPLCPGRLRCVWYFASMLSSALVLGCLDLPRERPEGPPSAGAVDVGPPPQADVLTPDEAGAVRPADMEAFEPGEPDGGGLPVDAAVSLPRDWHAPAWTHRKKVRVYSVRVREGATQVPVLVRLRQGRDMGLEEMRADGADLLFFDPADGRVLPHEIESWSPALADVWVRLPEIRPQDVDQFVWMYYGNEAAPPSEAGSPWEGYRTVLHMSGPEDTPFADVSPDEVKVIARGALSAADRGPGASGLGFDAPGNGQDYLDLRDAVDPEDLTDYTVSISVEGPPIGTEGAETLMDCTQELGFKIKRLGDKRYVLESCLLNIGIFASVEARRAEGWHHLTVTRRLVDEQSLELGLHLDGDLYDQYDVVTIPSNMSFLEFKLGRRWRGMVDEFRLHRGVGADIERIPYIQLSQMEALIAFGERPIHRSSPERAGSRHGGAVVELDFSDPEAPFMTDDVVFEPVGGAMTAIEHLGGGVRLRRPTLMVSDDAPVTLIQECAGRNALTIEAWLWPESTLDTGSARILTLSRNLSRLYFALVQEGPEYRLRLRTSRTDLAGQGSEADRILPGVPVRTDMPQHVVFTFDGETSEVIGYLNGQSVSRRIVPGTLLDWRRDEAEDIRLGIGNAVAAQALGTHLRPWLGTLYHLAVYCRALNSLMIMRNFDAGY